MQHTCQAMEDQEHRSRLGDVLGCIAALEPVQRYKATIERDYSLPPVLRPPIKLPAHCWRREGNLWTNARKQLWRLVSK
jgi:hypothetical protein